LSVSAASDPPPEGHGLRTHDSGRILREEFPAASDTIVRVSDFKAALRVSQISVAWTLVASAAAVAAGIASGGLVLVAFGATGLLDAAGSYALILAFRHALEHETGHQDRERLALRIIGTGLIVVGVLTAGESVRRLVTGSHPSSSAIGIAIACASAVVLAGLTARKMQLAARLNSAGLRADGWLSATGSLLAVIAVVGTLLAGRAKWADPSAALAVALGAVWLGVSSLRSQPEAT
jgi:divalent metal cation (Fe/Co/Zn/Cd) transporter